MQLMNIGQAAAAGVTPKMIRHTIRGRCLEEQQPCAW